MIVTKHFKYRDRDFKNVESLISKPQRYFKEFNARLVLYDDRLIKKSSSSCSASSSFERTIFTKIENDCSTFSSFVKNLFQIFGPQKEIQYFVDFREIDSSLRILWDIYEMPF